MDNREGTIVSIIANTNNRFTCYAKKICINLRNSMYARLIYLPLFFINRLHKKLYFFRFEKYQDSSQIVIALSLLPIAIYVSMIQHSIC